MKPKSFTQSMSWLHTWCGLLLGWVLFAIFLTGTLAVFDRELNWWMQPEIAATTASQAEAAETAQRWLEREYPAATGWNIGLPTERSPTLSVSHGEQRRGERTLLDASTGETLDARESAGGSFFFRFHFTLQMPRNLGIWLVGFAAMAMLVALVSGIVVHKKIFKEFFTFRPRKGQRSWLDGHNASAVLLLPFHLMITYTGLVIFCFIYMPAALDALYDGDRQAMQREARALSSPAAGAREGDAAPARMSNRGAERGGQERTARPAAPASLLPLADFIARGEAHYGAGMLAGLTVSDPGTVEARVTVRPVLGSRIELTKGEGLVFDGVSGEAVQVPAPSRTSQLTQRVMAGLHFAQFGGYPMRWLYFLCGLVSCVMIASGLVLYTVKRRKQTNGSQTFLAIAERLNTASVAGLSLACVALLWANRLIPAELAGRQAWEVRAFFGVWALTLLHAALRPAVVAWREQFYAAAALCLALPIPSLLGHFPMDGIRAGVESTSVALGLLLGWLAWKIPAIASKASAPKSRPPRLAGAQP